MTFLPCTALAYKGLPIGMADVIAMRGMRKKGTIGALRPETLDMERLGEAFTKRTRPLAECSCVVWIGGQGVDGKGRLGWQNDDGTRQTFMPQRVSWLMHHGSAPDASTSIDTVCGRKNCVNAAHLVLGKMRPGTVAPYVDKELLRARFAAKVQVGQVGKCWPWLGAKNEHGYGIMACKSEGRSRKLFAHKVAFYLHSDSAWPDKSVSICHHCDNPGCVNPHHLYCGTAKTNAIDASLRKRHQTQRRLRAATKQRILTPAQAAWVTRTHQKQREESAKPKCGCRWNYRTIRDAYGIGPTTLSRILNSKRSERDTKERNDTIRKLWNGPDGHARCNASRKLSKVWTLAAMAQKLGVSVGTVKRIINGKGYFTSYTSRASRKKA